MAQNVYDRPEFFEGYSQLGRSVHGLAGAAEWPEMRAATEPFRKVRGRFRLRFRLIFAPFRRGGRRPGLPPLP
ncbi:hypothetical protein ABIE33_002517 [Ensifer sp. 4252]